MRQQAIARKLFLILVVSASLPVMLLGYLSYNRSAQQIEKITSALITDNIANNAQRLSVFFSELEKLTYQATESKQVLELLGKSAPENFFDEIHWVSEMQNIVASMKSAYDLYFLPQRIDDFPNVSQILKLEGFHSDSPVFAKAVQMAGKPFWLHEVIDLTRPELVYVRTIRNANLSPVGLMVVRIPTTMLTQQVTVLKQFADFNIQLMNQEHTVFSLPMNRLLSHDHLAIKPMRLAYGFSTYNDGHQSYFASVRTIQGTQWEIAGYVPVKEAMGQVYDIRLYTFLIVAVVLALLLVFMYVVTVFFTRPIRMMAKHMRKVEHGTLQGMQLKKPRGDEIGQLVISFNSMIEGMKLYISRISEMEQTKNKLERQILIHQINPHFLYNTLDSIKWKAEAFQAKPVAEMVTTLGGMLRYSLMDGDEFVPVELELQHVTDYINIELLRNNHAFDVVYDIQPSALKHRMLKLIVQPLAENAIRHGINKLQDKRGKLLVMVYVSAASLCITIEDNGPGTDAEKLRKKIQGWVYSGDGGIGLYNVHRRLELHFGSAGGIEWHVGKNGGFRVEIRHPLIRMQPVQPRT